MPFGRVSAGEITFSVAQAYEGDLESARSEILDNLVSLGALIRGVNEEVETQNESLAQRIEGEVRARRHRIRRHDTILEHILFPVSRAEHQ